MRDLTTAAANALDADIVSMALLVQMDLTETMRLNHSRLDLEIDGHTWYGLHGLGRIEALKETAAEAPKIAFELSGVPSDMISLALSEPVQGKSVEIKVALFNRNTGELLDTSRIFLGALDVMTITDGKSGAVVTVTAESGAMDLLRPAGVLYTHEDQQRLYPGDLFFQYLNAQTEMRIVWPHRDFFKR